MPIHDSKASTHGFTKHVVFMHESSTLHHLEGTCHELAGGRHGCWCHPPLALECVLRLDGSCTCMVMHKDCTSPAGKVSCVEC